MLKTCRFLRNLLKGHAPPAQRRPAKQPPPRAEPHPPATAQRALRPETAAFCHRVITRCKSLSLKHLSKPYISPRQTSPFAVQNVSFHPAKRNLSHAAAWRGPRAKAISPCPARPSAPQHTSPPRAKQKARVAQTRPARQKTGDTHHHRW